MQDNGVRSALGRQAYRTGNVFKSRHGTKSNPVVHGDKDTPGSVSRKKLFQAYCFTGIAHGCCPGLFIRYEFKMLSCKYSVA